jgi:hypothetical protein
VSAASPCRFPGLSHMFANRLPVRGFAMPVHGETL